MMGAWVSFDEVKKNVSMEAALARYNVKLERRGAYLRGSCPLPTHQGPVNTFSVHVEKNVWACANSCCARDGKRGGNVLDFVSIMEKCSVRDAALLLARDSGIGEPSDIIGKQAVKKPEPEVYTVEPLPEEPVEEKGWLARQRKEWMGETLYRGPDETEGEWIKRAVKKISEKLLESYENGKRAGKLGK